MNKEHIGDGLTLADDPEPGSSGDQCCPTGKHGKRIIPWIRCCPRMDDDVVSLPSVPERILIEPLRPMYKSKRCS